jgi:hypothetical protein
MVYRYHTCLFVQLLHAVLDVTAELRHLALAAPSVRKNSNIIWFFAHLIVSLASPKILTLEKTQIKFGFLLA